MQTQAFNVIALFFVVSSRVHNGLRRVLNYTIPCKKEACKVTRVPSFPLLNLTGLPLFNTLPQRTSFARWSAKAETLLDMLVRTKDSQ